MKRIKIVEEECPACNGKGVLPLVKQAKPGRRIYPPRCTKCDGKGRRMKEAAN
jgi:DnaJ-class molecular chaperone